VVTVEAQCKEYQIKLQKIDSGGKRKPSGLRKQNLGRTLFPEVSKNVIKPEKHMRT